jgi:hypothetical protein
VADSSVIPKWYGGAAFGFHRKTDVEFQRYDVRMLTRRGFAARIGNAAAAGRMLPEMAYAQRAAVNASELPADVVWLYANENPARAPGSNRYHYQEFNAIYAAIAKSEDLAAGQIIAGCGSSASSSRVCPSWAWFPGGRSRRLITCCE